MRLLYYEQQFKENEDIIAILKKEIFPEIFIEKKNII
jgi:hypothetical protein